MISLSFAMVDALPVPYAAVPTLNFRLRLTESSGAVVQSVLLRWHLQIEPRRRNYAEAEQHRLLDVFGEPDRWDETLRPVLWAAASLMVPRFAGTTEINMPVACTYDFEVIATKYLQALDDGEIPLSALFSGSVFTQGPSGLVVHQIPWEREATYRLPVRVWRDLMDTYFPGAAWIRLRRDTLDALHRFRAERALPTWEDAIDALLERRRAKLS